jgi:hypothetical protein
MIWIMNFNVTIPTIKALTQKILWHLVGFQQSVHLKHIAISNSSRLSYVYPKSASQEKFWISWYRECKSNLFPWIRGGMGTLHVFILTAMRDSGR